MDFRGLANALKFMQKFVLMCLVYFSGERVLSSHQILQMVSGHLRGGRVEESPGSRNISGEEEEVEACRWPDGGRSGQRARQWERGVALGGGSAVSVQQGSPARWRQALMAQSRAGDFCQVVLVGGDWRDWVTEWREDGEHAQALEKLDWKGLEDRDVLTS